MTEEKDSGKDDAIEYEMKPDPSCKKCYGLGYSGTHVNGKQKGHKVPCDCSQKMLNRMMKRNPGKALKISSSKDSPMTMPGGIPGRDALGPNRGVYPGMRPGMIPGVIPGRGEPHE